MEILTDSTFHSTFYTNTSYYRSWKSDYAMKKKSKIEKDKKEEVARGCENFKHQTELNLRMTQVRINVFPTPSLSDIERQKDSFPIVIDSSSNKYQLSVDRKILSVNFLNPRLVYSRLSHFFNRPIKWINHHTWIGQLDRLISFSARIVINTLFSDSGYYRCVIRNSVYVSNSNVLRVTGDWFCIPWKLEKFIIQLRFQWVLEGWRNLLFKKIEVLVGWLYSRSYI